MEALQVGPGEVMARLSLPAAVADTRDRFVLHPSLMDAAVQALMGFSLAEDAGNGWAQRALPFEVREVEIYGPGTERMWAVVHRSAAAAGGAKIDRYDIDLCDETGRVSVRMRGLSTRSTRREGDAAARNEEPATLMAAAPPAVSDLQQRVQSALAQAITKLLKLRERHVDAGVEFGSLGFDSITFADFTRRLNKDYGLDLTPTVFFEYPTLEKFSRFLAETHQGVMASHFVPRQETPPPAARRVESAAPETRPSNGSARRARFAAAPRAASSPVLPASQNGAPEPIAIIGISGRFPMARDVDELWENLLNGRDCISEIPPQRWDWRAIYGDPRMEGNKTNVKWGGFIEGVDEFDPLFFNISPREARLMDPQQRLLMTHVWKVIEDAGYAGSSLAGSNTAIFVGAGLSDYDFVLGEPQVAIEDYSAIATAPSVGPHRMSYFLDLHGPSEPIETACSSSLLAVHRAVGAIRSGDCEMAIVGGVGTLLTPHRQVAYSKAGMLSPDGRCKTFSNRANGYVRGEGIGMLFLKKLREAEAAGDHIYGVIRGSSENHGGRANSLTAPNPKAQAELLKKAYLQAGVEPESVSYIETHGTGTELGDPIEIEGLKTAFSDLYRNRGSQPVAGHCGLGSVKSNIGHLEVAAGVAGIIKVLLQMQHKTLVPTLNCEPPNPYIQLAGSPFYIVREAMEWQARKDARGAELPRRAGVSSFSVSGANAHVVIEEYVPRDRQRSRSAAPERPVAVVLSARNEERLREQAQGLLAVLKKRGLADGDLLDVAYTLQVGREAMDARLGVVASSVGELEEKLLAFLGDGSKSGLYLGQARGNSEAMSILAAEEDFRGVVDRWIEQGRLDKVLDLWVKGMKVDWDRFYGEPKPRRLSLPTYPFARERYWATGATGAIWAATGATGATGATSGLTEPAPALRPAPSFVAAAPPAAAVHHQSPADELYEMLLTPVWEPLQTERQDVQRSSAGRMAIVGGTDDQRAAIRELHPEASLWALEPADSVEQMRRKIAPSGEIGHLVWIVPPHFPASPGDDSLLAAQSEGALFCFRLIKALLAEGYGDRLLTWSVITTETQAVHAGDLANPAHASVHGLVGSMAKEYADWNVRLLDLPASGEWPWRDLFAMAGDPHGNAAVYRGHRWYRRQLAPYRPGPETDTAYRPGGVYVVIGGAGGIGETWSEALLRRLPAQIVWIGRRPKDDAIQDKLDRLAALGPAPLYIAADATDYDQLESARATIKRELGRIDGVIHAAMVIQDHSLANMTEDEFRTGFSPKVDVCVRIAQVFGKEPLDFVLFFSSVAAFLKWPGQSNYVAGSTFEDAFADRLAAEWPCRVRVINWGYWAVGALDSERYRTLMARKGFGSIELPGAMQALDRLLSGPGRQLAYLAVLGPEALEGVGVLPAGWTAARTEDAQPAAPSPRQLAQGVAQETAAGSTVAPDKPGDITTESLLADLRLRVAETLGVDQAILDSPSRPFADALLGEFGMDSLSSNSLRNKLRRELGVDIPVHLIIGEKVHSIVGALYEQMLLQHVTKEPQHGNDEETETFVF
ncbi:MAG TPA: SDR family NAD(P)-dependent oxidoreductase [Thermoanaerobaculia bacterium]|nr:SDR family NAD(P)-dependent oxidoreductase [Thermoanaerobaculia bacterium]